MFKTNRILNKVLLFPYKQLFKHNSSIASILQKPVPGDIVTAKGWIKSLRNQKGVIFFDLNDGSTNNKLQVYLSKDLTVEGLTPGASVVTKGTLNLSPKGDIELVANTVEICGKCIVSEGYPFAPRKQYPPDYIRQFLHLRPRTRKFSSVLRLRHALTIALHSFFHSKGFFNINTPILTSNDCEGAGEVFKVLPENQKLLKTMQKDGQSLDEGYFNTKTFLTVSGQLHLEAAVHGLSKVYTLGPTFRAENSRSRLHLSEFYMLEAEIAFVESLSELTEFVEDLMKTVLQKMLDENFTDIVQSREVEDSFNWVKVKFPVLTYKEVIGILEKNRDSFKESFSSLGGLGKEHELFLVQHCGNTPIFVTEWPKTMKPFYMKESPNGTVVAFDLLGPNVGEIVGGSLRENDYDKLQSKLPENSNLDWYLELRKYGSVGTGGFGLGFERFLQAILGLGNIKDTIPFPRWPHNCNL